MARAGRSGARVRTAEEDRRHREHMERRKHRGERVPDAHIAEQQRLIEKEGLTPEQAAERSPFRATAEALDADARAQRTGKYAAFTDRDWLKLLHPARYSELYGEKPCPAEETGIW